MPLLVHTLLRWLCTWSSVKMKESLLHHTSHMQIENSKKNYIMHGQFHKFWSWNINTDISENFISHEVVNKALNQFSLHLSAVYLILWLKFMSIKNCKIKLIQDPSSSVMNHPKSQRWSCPSNSIRHYPLSFWSCCISFFFFHCCTRATSLTFSLLTYYLQLCLSEFKNWIIT